ncbi:hypothetical protein TrCOL_g3400 [Triparma columacea]|uniref:non-specific serine/threonine protein kinase n=1 Tax=Triparma columacea TaxID=722753 RepID=A0A9W7G818_9STRA|nr:hypothetical protein TrCOL_g3400 [Triparma columacea]
MMMWKVPTFVSIFNEEASKDERIADEVVRATGGELRKGWNPTVNKMRYLVLERIKDGIGEKGFKDTAERVYGRSTVRINMGNTQDNHTKDKYVMGEDRSDDSDVDSVASDDCQLTRIRKVAVKRNWNGGQGEVKEERTVNELMKEWRKEGGGKGTTIPPATITGVAPWGKGGRGQPPTTITGVAPWAIGGRGQTHANGTGVAGWGRGQPPVTVTGVAPWAMRGRGGMGRGGSIPIRRSRVEEKIGEEKDMDIEDSKEISIEDEKDTPSEEDMSNSDNPGYLRLLNFMEMVKPPKTSKYSPWAMTQLKETPTLLPNLKFHDLVFGQVLGEGAFSVVKYARKITRGTSRSGWDEYAVKIISIKTIKENGYAKSVNREIAVLKHLSHPGVARLVSAFRFRDGAYMVLEYAKGGDLHTLVTSNGSLDEPSARFVCGEVLAALCSVQAAGMVYGDLKPENVLMTESGHVKLGDFGGCRAVGEEAKDMLRGAMGEVDKLRDGDWKVRDGEGKEEYGKEEEKGGYDEKEEEDDERVEGTAAYLPPEVISGGKHGYPSDIWSFGCLLFFCLAGKPPIIDDTNDSTIRRVIKFAQDGEHADFFGKDKHNFTKASRSVITRCTAVSVSKRCVISELAADPWWGEKGVLNLHKGEAVELNVGKVKAGAVDKAWMRRQHSMIWSPQKEKYDFENEGRGRGGEGVEGKVEEVLGRTIGESEEGDFKGGGGGEEKVGEGGRLKIMMMARITEG